MAADPRLSGKPRLAWTHRDRVLRCGSPSRTGISYSDTPIFSERPTALGQRQRSADTGGIGAGGSGNTVSAQFPATFDDASGGNLLSGNKTTHADKSAVHAGLWLLSKRDLLCGRAGRLRRHLQRSNTLEFGNRRDGSDDRDCWRDRY